MREYIQHTSRQQYLEGVLQAAKVKNLRNYLSIRLSIISIS